MDVLVRAYEMPGWEAAVKPPATALAKAAAAPANNSK